MTWLTSILLNPALVYFLPLAVIPILLHLLTLHRLKTVELSTYRFLFDSYVQQRRRTQFLEALLAMLRTLFLLFLVLVFCRPVVKNWGGLFQAGTGRDVVILMDCSASMNARTGGQSAFDRAKTTARSVVQRLNAQDRLTLIRVVSKPEEVFSQFSSDADAIRDRIDGLKTGPSRANMFAALMYVFGPDAHRRGTPTVYVFTDCQSSGWKEVRNQGLEHLIPKDTPFVVVNVGSNKPVPNLAVVGDAPRRHRAIVGHPVFLYPRVVNHSDTADVDVSVFMDEKEIVRTTLRLKPGETDSRKVIYYPTEPGVHRGRFEISSKGPDQFPDDNSYLFTLTVQPQIKVLLVNGNPAAQGFESDSLYLWTALTTTREAGSGDRKDEKNTPIKDLQRPIDTEEISETALNPELLRDTSVVILANCGGLNPQQFVWLREFVASGGGLVIFPGDRVNPDVYNTQFFPVPGLQKEFLTPVRLGPAEGDVERADTYERLAVVDFTHAVLSVFDEPKKGYFEKVRFYRRFPLILPEKRANASPLAEFTSGSPAMVESSFGDGKVVVAAFPANTRWTNLPVRRGEFVPFVKRLVSHVQHRPEVEGPSVVPADSPAEVVVTGAWAPANGKVTDPAGRVTPITFERSGTRLLGAFEQTAAKGYYTVEVNSRGTELTREGTIAFAVNLAPEESEFTMVDADQLKELVPAAQLTFVDASAEAQQALGAIGSEHEVWRQLIWIVFAVIIIEFLLATLAGKKREAEETATVAERIRRISPGSWVARMTGAVRKGNVE
jgi:hypothetical protein